MEKKYQIFISSTYTDLIEVRREIAKAVLRQTEIPAAMEDFGSVDQAALAYIKEVIDQCDYYVLIIAGRYGSTDESGVSYTEQEYDYALSKSKTILVFIRKDISKIPLENVDVDKTKKRKLERFRNKVSRGRLVSYWDDSKTLITDVMIALSNAFRTHPGLGWVRANDVARTQIVEIERLQYENQSLRAEISQLKTDLSIENLDLESHLTIYSLAMEYYGRRGSQRRMVSLSWVEIFMILGSVVKINNDIRIVRERFSSIIASVLRHEGDGIDLSEIEDESFNTIIAYFMRYHFIEFVNENIILITRIGRRFMIEYNLLASKHKS